MKHGILEPHELGDTHEIQRIVRRQMHEAQHATRGVAVIVVSAVVALGVIVCLMLWLVR